MFIEEYVMMKYFYNVGKKKLIINVFVGFSVKLVFLM